jgi:HlyD family secretion protein
VATLFVIAEDLQRMQVDTSVSEADVGKLRGGMPATFTVDAYPGERFEGTVRQVRNAPTTVQNVVTYDAVIDVENKELKLRPGMTATVTFVWAERKEALRVPNAALRFRPPAELLDAAPGAKSQRPRPEGAPPNGKEGRAEEAVAANRRTVWVLEQGKPRKVMVTAGITDGTVTEVVDGDLKAGDACIVDAGSDKKAGASVGGAGGPPRRMF